MIEQTNREIDLEKQIDFLHTQAVENHKKENFKQAVEFYQKAIELRVEQPAWVYGNAITILGELGQSETAIDLGEQALMLYPNEDEIYRALGIVYERIENPVKSIEKYQKAIELNFTQPDWLYSNLAKKLLQENRTEEAIETINQGLHLYPDFYCLYAHLGLALTNQKKWDEAISAYRYTQELKPDWLEIEEKLKYVLYKRVQSSREQPDSFNHTENQAETLEKVSSNQSTPQNDRKESSLSESLEIDNNKNNGSVVLKDESVLSNECTEAISLSDNSLIIKIINQNNFDRQDKIYLNQQWLNNNYSWYFFTSSTNDYALLFIYDISCEDINLIKNLEIISSDSTKRQSFDLQIFNANNIKKVEQFFNELIQNAYQEVFKLTWTVIQNIKNKNQLSKLGQLLLNNFQGDRLTIDYGCWLAPGIIYCEGTVHENWVLNQTKILACSNYKCETAIANFFQTSHQQFAAVVIFQQNVYTEPYDSYFLFAYSNNRITLIQGTISQKFYSLEFIKHLNAKPEYQKHLIRETLSSSIIKYIPHELKSEAASLLNKLQYFINISPVNFVDPNLPFKVFIDYIVPIKSDGIFISGWLQDPYNMLETIQAISALGFTLSLSNQEIYRLERRDVNEHLWNTRYGKFEGKLGFCTYAAVPLEIRQTFEDFAELHSFRFQLKLKGNITIEIIPDVKYSDVYTARKQIMQIAPSDKVDEEMLAKCIQPAALKLQQLCIEQVKIKEITSIGKAVSNPLVSIVIPLYRRLDFMKVQLATMANDPAIKQCEIIYVLDSPEQEQELKSFLLNHCTLYQLPVKLVVMERNSGYAAANNAGVSQATGKYLILLNSDVFAKTKGWALQMADFYENNPKIGALGAKLVYEDGSLQHAGMFFAQTTFPFWLTLHYYKGLPGNYLPAQNTRPVPAVTGACLMISKELYDEVGGLTTDYVIGDFEDSDLCLKCEALGYQSWYFADATLYHLERQSVPLNSVYNGSLAWRLNGRLHQQRWGEQIARLMSIHQ